MKKAMATVSAGLLVLSASVCGVAAQQAYAAPQASGVLSSFVAAAKDEAPSNARITISNTDGTSKIFHDVSQTEYAMFLIDLSLDNVESGDVIEWNTGIRELVAPGTLSDDTIEGPEYMSVTQIFIVGNEGRLFSFSDCATSIDEVTDEMIEKKKQDIIAHDSTAKFTAGMKNSITDHTDARLGKFEEGHTFKFDGTKGTVKSYKYKDAKIDVTCATSPYYTLYTYGATSAIYDNETKAFTFSMMTSILPDEGTYNALVRVGDLYSNNVEVKLKDDGTLVYSGSIPCEPDKIDEYIKTGAKFTLEYHAPDGLTETFLDEALPLSGPAVSVEDNAQQVNENTPTQVSGTVSDTSDTSTPVTVVALSALAAGGALSLARRRR